MARLTSIDGRVYEIDEAALEQYRIPDEQVKQLVGDYDLPEAPPEQPEWQPPGPGPGSGGVRAERHGDVIVLHIPMG